MPSIETPSISFRQLVLLEAFGRLGSVSRAAAENGVTQPAATQALSALATKAGFPLLRGSTRSTALTPIGRDFHLVARSILTKLRMGLVEVGVAKPERAAWHITSAQIRLLGAASERGGLEKGAASIGVSWPSARRSMKSLRDAVGIPLFDRVGSQTLLTKAGTVLTRHIGLLAAELEWTLFELRERSDRNLSGLTVGVAPDPGTAALTRSVKDFVVEHPEGCLEVVEGAQIDLMARLAIGEVDIVVGHLIGSPVAGLAWEDISSDTYRVVGRRDHPLAGASRPSISELASMPWIMGARGSQRRAAADVLFRNGQRPSGVLVTSAAPLMAQLMADGDYLGLMTASELGSREGLTVIATDHKAMTVRIGIATRTKWLPTAQQRRFVELIKQRFVAPNAPPGQTVDGLRDPVDRIAHSFPPRD